VVAVALVVVASGVWSWMAGNFGRVVFGGGVAWVAVWYGWWFGFGTDLLGVGCTCLWVVCVVSNRVVNIVVVIYTDTVVYSLVVGCGK
jgi:hypothetical protein